MEMNRRQVCAVLPLLALGSRGAGAEDRLRSMVKPFEQLPVRKNAIGAETRPILQGRSYDKVGLEVHETVLPPGAAPHPPHRHAHDEMFLMMRGTLDITINGKTTRMGPGSAGFVAGDDEHGVKNTGAEPAQYFVIAIGSES